MYPQKHSEGITIAVLFGPFTAIATADYLAPHGDDLSLAFRFKGIPSSEGIPLLSLSTVLLQ